jgi:hypothetical protein
MISLQALILNPPSRHLWVLRRAAPPLRCWEGRLDWARLEDTRPVLAPAAFYTCLENHWLCLNALGAGDAWNTPGTPVAGLFAAACGIAGEKLTKVRGGMEKRAQRVVSASIRSIMPVACRHSRRARCLCPSGWINVNRQTPASAAVGTVLKLQL